MTKKWEVTVNGTNNVIEYKAGFGAKILVNGQAYKVKSQNWWVMMVDYPIMIDDTEIRVVAIGNKVDLAVNGVYQGSGEQYQPLHKTPTMCNVFIGISCIAGFLLCGWLGLLIGALFGTVYVRHGECCRRFCWMYGNTAFDHGHCSISSACIVKDGLHMEQGNYGENFDRGYEEQARPRQQVIVIGEPVPDKRTTKNLAICSLVLGILAIVFSFLPYIGIILALIALPQGIVSLVQKRPGKGLAIAGIITGIFGILLSILFILVYVVAVLAL